MKNRRILDAAIVSFCVFLVTGPASAQDAVVTLPEPGTLSIFALGIGAIYLLTRGKRRK